MGTQIKILLIEDDQMWVNNVTESLKKITPSVRVFKPVSTECEEMRKQLKKLCEENVYDVALLDFKLWKSVTGDLLIDILKEARISVIAFSSNFNHCLFLMRCGAVDSICKDDLLGSRGFNEQKFLDLLNASLLKIFTHFQSQHWSECYDFARKNKDKDIDEKLLKGSKIEGIPAYAGFPRMYGGREYEIILRCGEILQARVDDSRELMSEGLEWGVKGDVNKESYFVVAWSFKLAK